MNAEEFAEITRSMIQHENELLNHRVSWMLALQGMLAAAFSFIWKDALIVELLICSFGFLASLSFSLSFRSSMRAIHSLLDGWHKYADENPGYTGPPVIGAKEPHPKTTFFHPWHSLPWLAAIFWVILAWSRTSCIS